MGSDDQVLAVLAVFVPLYATWISVLRPTNERRSEAERVAAPLSVLREDLKKIRASLPWQVFEDIVGVVGAGIFATKTAHILNSGRGLFSAVRFAIVVLEIVWALCAIWVCRRIALLFIDRRRTEEAMESIPSPSAGKAPTA